MLDGNVLNAQCPCPSSTSCCQGEIGRPGQKVRVSINHSIFSTKWIYSKMRYNGSACLQAVTESTASAWLCTSTTLTGDSTGTLTGCKGCRAAEMGYFDGRGELTYCWSFPAERGGAHAFPSIP